MWNLCLALVCEVWTALLFLMLSLPLMPTDLCQHCVTCLHISCFLIHKGHRFPSDNLHPICVNTETYKQTSTQFHQGLRMSQPLVSQSQNVDGFLCNTFQKLSVGHERCNTGMKNICLWLFWGDQMIEEAAPSVRSRWVSPPPPLSRDTA